MKQTLAIVASLFIAASASSDSLWTSKRTNEAGMFADRVAGKIGDIILVRVDEKTILSHSTSKSLSSSTGYKAGITSYFFPQAASNFGTLNGALPAPEFSKSNDSFQGEGTVDDTNIMQAKASVQVVDVLTNGNLVIEGARRITTTGETQYLILHGTVRKDDIMTDNSVYSYNIVNGSVETMGEGDLIKNQREGLIKQLIDTVNIL